MTKDGKPSHNGVDYLYEHEMFRVAHCIDEDKVEPLKPLIDKYGFKDLLDRFGNSIHDDDFLRTE